MWLRDPVKEPEKNEAEWRSRLNIVNDDARNVQ